MAKREKVQSLLTQYYGKDNVLPWDSHCLIEDLEEAGYRLIKIRNKAPRAARKVIVDFLKMFYSRDDMEGYMENVDEDILLDDLQDAGYQIVKIEGKEDGN